MHAVITGASSGIGAAIARRLAAEGYDCTLVARRRDRLEAVAEELSTRTHVLVADLAAGEADPIVQEAEGALGPIDVLVNNAGIQYVQPAHTLDAARLDRMLGVNLITPWRLTQRVLADMVPRQGGAIVNISSISGVHPLPGMAHYAGTKAALAITSEALRAELAPHGVHVLTVYPGPVHTDMEQTARAAFGADWRARLAPTGTAERLADHIARALRRRAARVVYPRAYAPGWWLAGLATSLTLAAAPRLD